MFTLCSFLLLSATPDADTTVHAPAPCRTPAELHTSCTKQRGWPDPLFDSSEADFQRFLDGTLDAYSRDPDRQQAWLDAFALFLERLEPQGKIERPPWTLVAKQRLAREIVAAYSSGPPHSCERAAQVMLAHFGRHDELIEPGLVAVVGDLEHPDPARACWAARVLRVLLRDNLLLDFAPAQLHAKTPPDGPYGYPASERPVDRAVAGLLGKHPSIHEQLATLGFAHDSYDAFWLIGLLPPEQAFAVLEPHIRAPNNLPELQFIVAALWKSDWTRACSPCPRGHSEMQRDGL